MNKVLREWMQTFRERPWLFGWMAVILFLFCLLDFFARIFVARDSELRKFNAPVLLTMPRDETAELVEARLTAALPAVPQVDEAAQAKPREIALQGVFGSRGQRTAILVLLPQDEKPLERRNLQQGGEIDGWLVERIEGTRVMLRKGSESKELVMFRGKSE